MVASVVNVQLRDNNFNDFSHQKKLPYETSSTKEIYVTAEVVGFKDNIIQLMPLGTMEGLKPGSIVINTGSPMKIQVGYELLGRVLDGLGNPIDANIEIKSNKYL